MSRKETSKQLSIREGAGYDEVFQTGHEPEKGLSWSSDRETSTCSPDEEVESCVREGGEEEEIDEGEDEGDEGEEDDGDEGDADEKTLEVGSSGSPGMGIPVHLSSPKCGPSMTSYQRLRPTFLRI